MNLIDLWWLTLGALIGFLLAWIWDWLWFRARRQVVSVDVETTISKLQDERDKLATELQLCGDRRIALEADLADTRAKLGDGEKYRVQIGQLEPLVGQVDSLKAENARLLAELEVAQATSTPLGSADHGEIESLRAYNLSMYDEIAASRQTLARISAGKGDPLIDIDGIGPVYQQKLYDAGVISFDQVASMHPDRLRALVAPNAAFELHTDSWIEEARRFAKLPVRDPLIDINGIGPVYEQRLLNAGVTSFAQLTAMTPAEIRAIINPEEWQLIEPENWIAEAATFAQQMRDGTYLKGRD